MERKRILPSDPLHGAILEALRGLLSQSGETPPRIPALESILGVEKMLAGLLDPLPEVMRAIGLHTSEAVRSTKSVMEQIHDANRQILGVMAIHGWYLDPHLTRSYLISVANRLSTGQSRSVDEELCDHFDSRASTLHSELAARFPDRARLLGAAFDAHDREQYALSIPVFLSQADGICSESTGRQLYSIDRGTRRPRVAAEVDEWDADDFRNSSAYPFTFAAPIVADTRREQDPRSELNRHAVMHGLSCDYDTRLNSCKAISLLAHVAYVFDPKWWQGSETDNDAP